jgi:hypothetical protein
MLYEINHNKYFMRHFVHTEIYEDACCLWGILTYFWGSVCVWCAEVLREEGSVTWDKFLLWTNICNIWHRTLFQIKLFRKHVSWTRRANLLSSSTLSILKHNVLQSGRYCNSKLIWPFEAESCLYVVWEFIPYREETHHHYRHQLINAVPGMVVVRNRQTQNEELLIVEAGFKGLIKYILRFCMLLWAFHLSTCPRASVI